MGFRENSGQMGVLNGIRHFRSKYPLLLAVDSTGWAFVASGLIGCVSGVSQSRKLHLVRGLLWPEFIGSDQGS
ncbi:MAG: hypothetical protein Ct9H300mP11_26290 [Chloroflexota bacterium]|nr:MAG: hypothetical protein Ct9H300mP11_26290 [Chloroflexota bacterium]